MNPPSDLTVRKLEYVARAARQASDDLAFYSEHGATIVYNVDFGLLYPQLFDDTKTPPSDSTKSRMARVLGDAPHQGEFSLAVSGPTLLELEDQLAVRVKQLKNDIPDRVSQYLRGGDSLLKEALKTSSEIRNELIPITKRGLAQLDVPVTRFLDMLANGTLTGIGDLIDKESLYRRADGEQFEALLAQHIQARSRHERRSRETAEFHYKLDVANVLLTLAAASDADTRTVFVTPTPTSVAQCTIDDETYGGSELIPLSLLNSAELHRDGVIGDRSRFLASVAESALGLADELRTYSGARVPDLTVFKSGQFEHYELRLITKGLRVEGDAESYTDVSQAEEILETITNAERLNAAIDEGIDTLQRSARRVDDLYEEFDVLYVDEMDFTDDPVMHRIRRDLGLPRRDTQG